MLRLAARLPDALVGLAARPWSRTRPGPRTIGHSRRGSRWLRRVCSRIESSTAPKTSFWRWSNAPLPIRTGPRAGVAGEVVEGRLGQVAPAVDAVHDLKRAVLVGLEVGDELHELVGLPVEVQPVQRLQGEGRVAHPGVAVVPVALAPGRLGQGGGERGHRGAGRHVGQPLDRQRRALDRLPVAMVGHARPVEPARARSASWRRSAPRRRPRRPARRARSAQDRAQNARSPGPSTCRARTRAPLDAERAGRCAGESSGPPPSRRPRGGRRRPGSTRPACARSRRPARRRARSRPGPRGTRPCAPAGARRRRRRAGACGA